MIFYCIFVYLFIGSFISLFAIRWLTLEEFLGIVVAWLPVLIIKSARGAVVAIYKAIVD